LLEGRVKGRPPEALHVEIAYDRRERSAHGHSIHLSAELTTEAAV
jgi:hypothetical protein